MMKILKLHSIAELSLSILQIIMGPVVSKWVQLSLFCVGGLLKTTFSD